MEIKLIFHGFPGKISRGYMGWSSVVYIESAGKKLVYDTGGFVERSELPKRFTKLGLDMTAVDYLILSHFHHDHVINFDYFPNARMIIHKKEFDWIMGDPGDWAVPKHLIPAVQKTGRLDVIEEDCEIIPGVRTLLSPGHTPGLISLFVQEENRTTVVAGDAVKNLEELVSGNVDMSLDNDASARSIKKIAKLADRIIPGHDRVFEVYEDQFTAPEGNEEIIEIPRGVVYEDRPKHFHIKVPPCTFTRIKGDG